MILNRNTVYVFLVTLGLLGCESSTDALSSSGHGGGTSTLPRAGEFRVERLQTAAGYIVRMAGFALKSGDLALIKETCSSPVNSGGYPYYLPDARTYFDPGSELKISIGDNTYTVPQSQAFTDYIARTHEKGFAVVEKTPDQVAKFRDDTKYTVAVSGSDEFPAVSWTGFMPKNYSTTPEIPVAAPLEIKRNQDFVFTWTLEQESSPDSKLSSFLLLADPAKGVYARCVSSNTGSITIPKEFVNGATETGAILHAVVDHQVMEYKDRSFDVAMANCKTMAYKLVD